MKTIDLKMIRKNKSRSRTLTTTVELDLHFLVHILAEVKNILLLRLFLSTATTATFLLGPATSTTTAPSE